jgi:lipopolysaccharide/colanic/teichoic acid biosynthesis glycosyltransferase
MDVLDEMKKYRVDDLIVLEHIPGMEFQTFVARCRSRGMHVNVLPRGYELYSCKPRLIEIEGLTLVSLDTPSRFPLALAIKRALDILFTLLLSVPAMIITAGAGVILLITKRSVIRRETRVGKNGRLFSMYRLDIDRYVDSGFRSERLLRDLSISELPQLWNVLRGEMSLVGPRPESPERVRHYSEWQRERLKVMPGMTGLAQVNGLREEHSSEDKTRFDLQYILEWSPFLDIALLLQTLGTLVDRCFGRRLAQVIEIPRQPENKAGTGALPQPFAEVVHADRA